MSFFKSVQNTPVENTNKMYRPLAFVDLKDEELVAVYNVAPVKKVVEGAIIAEAEAQQNTCYAVMSGSVRLISAVKGSTRTLSVLGRGEWFGRLGTPETLPYTVAAAEPSTLLQITASAMLQLP